MIYFLGSSSNLFSFLHGGLRLIAHSTSSCPKPTDIKKRKTSEELGLGNMSVNDNRVSSDSDSDEGAKGLKIELHPVLQSDNIRLVKSLYNDKKQQESSTKSIQNPYLTTSNKKGQKRKLISLDNDERNDERNAEINDDDEPKFKKNDTKEKDSFGSMDSWDAAFYNQDMSVRPKYLQDYDKIGIEDDSEEELDADNDEKEVEFPSIRFIQHPVPYKANEGSSALQTKFDSTILTKQERMKLRREERKKKRIEMFLKIQNGELLKPENKISLKKVNNVLMNDKTIDDPTKFEQEVKKQIQARRKEHDEMNNKRKQEAEEKRKQQKLQADSLQVDTGYHCKVFQIHNLSSPKIRFQINTTAKQLKLVGLSVRLRTDIESGKGIIMIISNKLSNMNKFERKLFKFNNTGNNLSTSFKIEKVWDGPVVVDEQNGVFIKKNIWFMREFSDENAILEELKKKGLTKYWQS